MKKLAINGGSPVRKKILKNRKSMGDQEVKAALRVLKSDVLSGFIAAAS